MFRKKSFHAVRMIRFRHWSRKKDAVFCSLKRHVTIGCVGKSITEASLSKKKNLTAWENFRSERCWLGLPETEEPGADGGDTLLLEGALCLVAPAKGRFAGCAGRKENKGVPSGVKDLFIRAKVTRAGAVFPYHAWKLHLPA